MKSVKHLFGSVNLAVEGGLKCEPVRCAASRWLRVTLSSLPEALSLGLEMWSVQLLPCPAAATRAGGCVCVQSSQDLLAPALVLGTLEPEFCGRNLVQAFFFFLKNGLI